MDNEQLTELAGRMERLAAQAALGLEQQMAEPAADTRKARELAGVLRDLLGLARELRGDEGRPVTVAFLGDSADAAV